MLVSTYQTGKLICARHDGGQLNTHFRNFSRPMGLAVAPGRIAIGTRAEVLDYRNFPAVAPKVEPRGKHDACFLPRNKHFTGDIRIHEVDVRAGGALDRRDQLLLPGDARRGAQLHPALEAAVHLRRSPRRTAAT